MKVIQHLLFLMLISTMSGIAQTVDTLEKNAILAKLESIKSKGILFGHQDDLAYGVGWEYVQGESDVKRVTGDYPALFGWELGGIEREDEVNLDKVPFVKMRELAAITPLAGILMQQQMEKVLGTRRRSL